MKKSSAGRNIAVFLIGSIVASTTLFAIKQSYLNSKKNDISHQHSNSIDPSTSCGPVSLGLVGRWLGASSSISELTHLTHSDNTGTTSLLDLKEAAGFMGLAAEGVRITPGRPMPWRLPMILHMKHHFAAAIPIEGGSMVLADPPNRPIIVSLDELKGRWDGYALVVAPTRRELDVAIGGGER